MASVSSLVRSGDGRMKFIDYENTYKDNNKEFLRGDMWELSFINAPKIVYYPGDDIINARLNSVQVGIDYSATGIEKRMRGGWNIQQRTNQNTGGTLSLSFVDKEDCAISYWTTDWRNKIADPDTKYSFRKDDLVCDIQLVITNAQRIDVKTLNFWNCQFQDAPINENGELESEADRADVTISLTLNKLRG
jgi:hypothetical protein